MSYGIPRLNSFMSFCDYMQKKRVMERRPNVIPSPKKCRWLNNKKSFSFFFFSFFFFFKSVEYLSWKDCYIQSLYGISFSSWKEKRDKNDEIHKFKRREVNPLLFLPHLYENRFCWRATQLPWLANLICFLFLLQVCVLPPFFFKWFLVCFFSPAVVGSFSWSICQWLDVLDVYSVWESLYRSENTSNHQLVVALPPPAAAAHL